MKVGCLIFPVLFVTTSALLCPRDGVYPDPKDCSKYYICESGQSYNQSCFGQYFDWSALECSNSRLCEAGLEHQKAQILQHQFAVEQELLRSTRRPDYDTTDAPSSTNPNWMSKIPDSSPLTSLTIPGTHNSMSLYGGPWAECQTWSLFDQYRAGIRFADIRTRHFNNGLPIHHGIMFQKSDFTTVLKETIRFLDAYPSETILMRVKEEYKAENNDQSYPNTVYDSLMANIPAHRRWDDHYLPSMGQARGKIIVLRDFVDWRWVHFRLFSIDDMWDVPSIFHIGSKWDSVWNHLERAQNSNNNYGFMTFTSGSSAWAFPSAVATRINPKLWDVVKGWTGKTRWGVVVMDFPGVDLIQKLINSNFA